MLVYRESLLSVLDNTGVSSVKCLRVVGNHWKRGALPADQLVVSIRKCVQTKKLKRGGVLRAVLVRSKQKYVRVSGFCISFNTRAVVLLKRGELLPIASRVLGSVYLEIKQRGFLRVAVLASFLC